MKRVVLLMCFVFLSACVAETVQKKHWRKGPVKEVGFVEYGGGQVRYSLDGWSWFVAGRRRHAFRLMRRNCGKKLSVKILDEYMRQDADIAYAGEDVTTNLDKGMDHFKIAPYQHLVYECRPKEDSEFSVSKSSQPAKAILVVPAQAPETSREEKAP